MSDQTCGQSIGLKQALLMALVYFSMVTRALGGDAGSGLSQVDALVVVDSIATQTDHSMIVAGIQLDQSWASKIDANGTQIWTLLLPSSRSGGKSRFASAIVRENGDTILCGTNSGEAARNELQLIRVGPGGEITDKNYVVSNVGEGWKIGSIEKCIAVRDGVLAVGTASRYRPGGKIERSYITVKVAANGEIIQNIIHFDNFRANSINSVVPLANGNIAMCGVGNSESEVVIVDDNGILLNRRSLESIYIIVDDGGNGKHIQLISAWAKNKWSMIELTEKLDLISNQSRSESQWASIVYATSKNGEIYAVSIDGRGIARRVPRILKIKSGSLLVSEIESRSLESTLSFSVRTAAFLKTRNVLLVPALRGTDSGKYEIVISSIHLN